MKENVERKEDKKAIIWGMLIVCTIAIIIDFVIPAIGATIWYYNTMDSLQEELATYSSDVYEELIQSTKQIFNEEKQTIDIKAKPDNIIIEDIEMKDNDKFICKLFLDNGENREYFPIPRITAEISWNFEILSATSSYSSKEQFIQAVQNNVKIEANNVFGEIAIRAGVGLIFVVLLVMAVLITIPVILKIWKRTFLQKE